MHHRPAAGRYPQIPAVGPVAQPGARLAGTVASIQMVKRNFDAVYAVGTEGGVYSDESGDDEEIVKKFKTKHDKSKKIIKTLDETKNKTKADYLAKDRKNNKKWHKTPRYNVVRGYMKNSEIAAINTQVDARAIHADFASHSKDPENQAVTGTAVVCCVMKKKMAGGGYAYKKYCFSNNGGAIGVPLVIAAQKKGYQFIQTPAEHAEMSAIEYAKRKGHMIVRMGVSIPHCSECTKAMNSYFGDLTKISDSVSEDKKYENFNLSPFMTMFGLNRANLTLTGDNLTAFQEAEF